MENNINRVKRSKSDPVKTAMSIYSNRRQIPVVSKKRKASRKTSIKRALLDTRISRPNSFMFSCRDSSDATGDTLITEYNLMFQKFMGWLKDQIEYRQKCRDVEKVVGPLFCHFYLDILRNNDCQTEKASTFFLAHLEKVDKSKCDSLVRDLINSIESETDITQFSEKLRSSKVVMNISQESLDLLKKFIVDSTHVILLQVLQKWFEFRSFNDIENTAPKSEKPTHKNDAKDYKPEGVQSVIRKVKQLKFQWANIQVTNNKHNIVCGIIKRQLGAIALAESNILKIMPIHEFDPLLHIEDETVNQVKFCNHSQKIYSISLSPKYDFLCTGSADRTICIYSLQKLKLHKQVWGHIGPVYCTAFSDSGKYLASGSQDGTARLWNVKSGKTLRIFAGHKSSVTCVQFHPNTLYIATGSSDRNCRVWCLRTGNPVRLFYGAKCTIDSLAFDPSGLYLACASEDKKIRIWDMVSSKPSHDFKYRDGNICSKLVWDKKSKQLVAGFANGLVKIWDIQHHSKEHTRHHSKDHSKEHSHHAKDSKDQSKDYHSNKDKSRDNGKEHQTKEHGSRAHSKEKERDKEPSFVTRQVNGRILDLEFSMGVWGSLSI